MPSLSSFLPTEKPGASRGTTKAEIPEEGRKGGREGGREGGRDWVSRLSFPPLSYGEIGGVTRDDEAEMPEEGRERGTEGGREGGREGLGKRCNTKGTGEEGGKGKRPTFVLQVLICSGKHDGSARFVGIGDPGLAPI